VAYVPSGLSHIPLQETKKTYCTSYISCTFLPQIELPEFSQFRRMGLVIFMLHFSLWVYFRKIYLQLGLLETWQMSEVQ
jgi:hypothetical protein